MANAVSQLKAALGAGARSAKYRVTMTLPTGGPDGIDLDALCSAASFPGIELGSITVWTQGRKLILPGDVSYSNTWSLTFYQTEEHQLRKDFLKWISTIDDFKSNTRSNDYASLMTEVRVAQLDGEGNTTVEYLFKDMFPTSIGEVSVSDESENSIESFDVSFAYTYWEEV